MKKYESISQFRNVIREVRGISDFVGIDLEGKSIYKKSLTYPKLKFIGTVKVHGSNAGIVKYKDRIDFQSRERVLSLHDDNAGFFNTMETLDLEFLFERFNFEDNISIWGEWSGGNIQKGVAINGLKKMFIIFGIKVDGIWAQIPKDLFKNEIGIYNIFQFPTVEIEIDFNFPERVQNELIRLTIEVEEKCPVGAFFNVEGVGEGIVFTSELNQDLKFKSKGEKHSVSKVKILNPVDMEKLESLNEFIEYSVTENRLEQGLSHLEENNLSFDSKNIGPFISWMVKDVLKEEKDLIDSNQFNESKIKFLIANKARAWFLNKI
jgi:hypothetical protein